MSDITGDTPQPDWVVNFDTWSPETRETTDENGQIIIHEPILIEERDDNKEWIYPTANGYINRIILTTYASDTFHGKIHALTHEQRALGGTTSSPKKRLSMYLTGLLNRDSISPRQREYIKHIRDNNFEGLVKQMTADLLASSDDPKWIHSIYKDIIKLIPKQTIIDITHTTEESNKSQDLTALGLSVNQQKQLGNFLVDMMSSNENIKTIDINPVVDEK